MPIEECQLDGTQGKAIEASKHVNQKQDLKLHFDKIRFGGKILYQDEKITVVPAVLMAEGVQNRALKPWQEFYDPEGLEGALWLEGVPITREHPPSYVTHLTTKLGKVRNVQPDLDGRRILAEAVLFNDRLTPEELKKIEAGEMLGGSIGFWCRDEPLEAPEIWTDGQEYDVIQRRPFFFDHFALVTDPACSVCGINVNDCKCKKHSEVNDLPDDKKAASSAEGQPTVDEQKPPEGDPKPPEAKADEKKPPEGDPKPKIDEKKPEVSADKKPEAKPAEAPKTNALDAQTLMIKARTILEMSDDYAKAKEALAFLMEIVAEEGVAVQGASKREKPVVEMDSKLIEKLNELETRVDSQASELKTLKEDNKVLKDEKTARDAAQRAEQEEKTKAGIKALLNQNAQMDFDAKHWPEIQKDGFNVWISRAENAKLLDVKSKEDAKITPVGQEFVPHGDEFDGAGVASVATLTKKYYPGAKEPVSEKKKEEGK